MKKILLFATALTFTLSSFAQTTQDYVEIVRDILKTEKKVAIAEVMELTDQESGPFWDLYNEYNFELTKIQNQRLNSIYDFAENYDKMTDEKADELWKSVLSYQGDLLKLQKSYYKKFKKIIPAGKAATYFQAENKIAMMINAELALSIPFIEVTE